MKMKYLVSLRPNYFIFMKNEIFGLTETKLFHFQRIFKSGGGGGRGVQVKPPLDPPLASYKYSMDVNEGIYSKIATSNHT